MRPVSWRQRVIAVKCNRHSRAISCVHLVWRHARELIINAIYWWFTSISISVSIIHQLHTRYHYLQPRGITTILSTFYIINFYTSHTDVTHFKILKFLSIILSTNYCLFTQDNLNIDKRTNKCIITTVFTKKRRSLSSKHFSLRHSVHMSYILYMCDI